MKHLKPFNGFTINELFGLGKKPKYKKGDIVFYKDETVTRKVRSSFKDRDSFSYYLSEQEDKNGDYVSSPLLIDETTIRLQSRPKEKDWMDR